MYESNQAHRIRIAVKKIIVLIVISFFSDPPRILSVGPDRLTTAPLFSPAAFECVAEGNPPPSYQWLQR